MRGLLLLALCATTASADPHVAPAGCVFDRVDQNGERYEVTSHGVAGFPRVAFSSTRFGEGGRVNRSTPFCGLLCSVGEGADAIRSLFPLEIRKSVTVSRPPSATQKFTVTAFERVEPMGIVAYRVEIEIDGSDRPKAVWWSPEVGWSVQSQVGDRFVQTTAISCYVELTS